MKKCLISTLFLSAIFLYGCSGRSEIGEIPNLDIGAAIDAPKVFDLVEIADNIDFVPLDGSTTESLVGGYINTLAESKNRWYVGEMNTPVKIFDKAGKFLSTRGRIGRGPDEFSGLSIAGIDWEIDNLYLNGRSEGRDRIVAYDAAGAIFARADSVLSSPAGMKEFHREKLFMWTMRRSPFGPPADPDAKETLYETFSSDLEPAGKAEVSGRNNVSPVIVSSGIWFFFQQGFLSGNGRSLLTYETLADTVFLVDNTTLSPAYVVDLGSHSPPDGAFGENATVQWNTNYYVLRRLTEGDRFVFAEAANYDPVAGGGVTDEYLIFDRRDSFNGFRATGPSGQNGLFIGGIKFTPCYIRDNRLVGWMQAFDIVDNAAAITNPNLKALAATLKEDSNPVIVVATLKR
jgi:hypothetical protein